MALPGRLVDFLCFLGPRGALRETFQAGRLCMSAHYCDRRMSHSADCGISSENECRWHRRKSPAPHGISVKFYLTDGQVLHLLCIHGGFNLSTVRSISINGECK